MVYEILGLFLANAGLFLWVRSESRNDWKHMDAKIDAIQNEIKDFHTKLALQDLEFKTKISSLEEKYYAFLMSKKEK